MRPSASSLGHSGIKNTLVAEVSEVLAPLRFYLLPSRRGQCINARVSAVVHTIKSLKSLNRN